MGGHVEDHVQWRRAALPSQLGEGIWEFYQLQQGLELTISRYRFDQSVRVDFIHDRPMFCFGCLVEGGFELRRRQARYSSVLDKGHGMNMWTSEGQYSFHLAANRYIGVQLIVDPEVLIEKLGEVNLLSPDLRQAVSRTAFPARISTNRLSPRAYEASNQALSVSTDDPLRMLQFESLALAILREQLLSAWTPSNTGRSLSRRDCERLHAVRDTLLLTPEQSPTLNELARRAGMNEFSLTRGFRLQFGQSIYEFLRRQRMEIADQLLAEGQYTIAEVAHAVGYRSPGRFSAAFQRHFGVTPKRHQLILRHRYSGQVDLHPHD